MANGILTPAELTVIQATYAHIPAIARLLLHARTLHYQLEAVTAERDELRFYRQMEEQDVSREDAQQLRYQVEALEAERDHWRQQYDQLLALPIGDRRVLARWQWVRRGRAGTGAEQ